MPKVLFFSSLAADLTSILTRSAPPHFDVAVHPVNLNEEQQKELGQDADFLILFTNRPSDAVLRSARQVKLIQMAGAGYDGP